MMQPALLVPVVRQLGLVGFKAANVMRLAEHKAANQLVGLLADLAAGCVLLLLTAVLVRGVGVVREQRYQEGTACKQATLRHDGAKTET